MTENTSKGLKAKDGFSVKAASRKHKLEKGTTHHHRRKVDCRVVGGNRNRENDGASGRSRENDGASGTSRVNDGATGSGTSRVNDGASGSGTNGAYQKGGGGGD